MIRQWNAIVVSVAIIVLTSLCGQSVGYIPNPEDTLIPVYYAPYYSYDDLALECALADAVIDARKDDPRNFTNADNPYSIRYAVYNVEEKCVIERLIEAYNSGVYVQVLDPVLYITFTDLSSKGFYPRVSYLLLICYFFLTKKKKTSSVSAPL